MISGKSKIDRLAIATAHSNGEADFRGVLFVDSEVFDLDKAGGRVCRWKGGGQQSCRQTQAFS